MNLKFPLLRDRGTPTSGNNGSTTLNEGMESGRDPFSLLDSAEARAALRVSKSTLNKLVREGRLRRSSVSQGRALFTWGEIQRLIATPLTTTAA